MADVVKVLVPLEMTIELTSSVTAQPGKVNLYNAVGGELAPPFPLIEDVPDGTLVGFAKSDASSHHVIATCQGGDTIMDLITVLPLTEQTQMVLFQSLNGAWYPIGGYRPLPAGTLVDTNSSQTLTGKTLDGDLNTFQDIPVTALGTGRVRGYSGGGTVIDANRGLWLGTQAEYDAIVTKSSSVLYGTT